MSQSTVKKIPNNYFDGMPVTGFHKIVFFIIMMAYFCEQMDNWNFGFIAPALMHTWGLQISDIGVVTLWYFIGMTAGRFLSGLLSIKLSGKTVIVAGQCVTLAAILLIMFNLPMVATYAGLFMIGFGNGPLFPSMTHLTPKVFGKSVSQSMIGTLMGFSYISILGAPFIFGQLAGRFGSWLFPYFALAMYVLMMISTAFFMRRPADK